MYYSDSDKPAAAGRWIRHVVVHRWRHKAFSLTHLSLQTLQMSRENKVEKTGAAQYLFYQTNGAGHGMFYPARDAITLRRSDFRRLHDYTLAHASLRDFCIVRVPMKTGIRPGEVRCLQWNQVDFTRLTLNLIDSKKYEVFPVPMDALTAEYLQRLHEKFRDTWVFAHDPESHAWKHWTTCLSYDAFDKIIKKWARVAGCQTWRHMTLYMLRHYFAANWAYPPDGRRPGNLHALSRILRHKSLASTEVYLSRLVFYEDLQAEYNRLQPSPLAQQPNAANLFFEHWCRRCDHQLTCRFVDQAAANPWAMGCRFFEQKKLKKEEMQHNRI
jgi:hypothetical protein